MAQSGQELCQLARADSKPVARLALNESGLAGLNINQPVRFSFGSVSLPTRYGALSGKLDRASPSAIAATSGGYFVALASVDELGQSASSGVETGHER